MSRKYLLVKAFLSQYPLQFDFVSREGQKSLNLVDYEDEVPAYGYPAHGETASEEDHTKSAKDHKY